MLLNLRKILFRIAIALVAAREFQQSHSTLAVLLNEFPKHRAVKIFQRIIIRLEKSRSLHWVFTTLLVLYRLMKTAAIQSKYGKFAKNLIHERNMK